MGGFKGLGSLPGQNFHFLRGLSISDRPSLVCSEQLHTRPGQTKRVSKHIEDQRCSGSSSSPEAFSIRTAGHQGAGAQSGLWPHPTVPKEQLGFPILKKKLFKKK